MGERDSYLQENAQQLGRMRALVERLSEQDLGRPVNDAWSIAGVLGHLAFWDGRALVLAERLRRGLPFSASDAEPEDVDWINDATRPLIHAIPPETGAALALEIAKRTDAMVASLSSEEASAAWPNDPQSPLNLNRAAHRGEHLDEIEAALAHEANGGGIAGGGQRAPSIGSAGPGGVCGPRHRVSGPQHRVSGPQHRVSRPRHQCRLIPRAWRE